MKTEEILKIINAYKEGKTIEFRFKFGPDVPTNRSNEWDYEVPSSGDYNWNFAMYEYRIKEEHKTRPYRDKQEFFKAMKEHGPYIIYPNPPVLEKPDNDKVLPIMPSDIGTAFYVNAYGHFYKSYQHLTNYYWQDGTPCGILENE